MIGSISPAYTIPKSTYPIFHKEIPGPGNYQVSPPMSTSAHSYSFSKSLRKIHDIYSIPGPGVYNPSYTARKTGFSLSKSPRFIESRNRSPGPGEYDYKRVEKRYQWSISKARNRSYNAPQSPGPGYYSPNTSFSKGNSPKMQFPKQDRMQREKLIGPPPGQYFITNSPPKGGFSIPKASPKFKISLVPGPGLYEIPSTIGHASIKPKNH